MDTSRQRGRPPRAADGLATVGLGLPDVGTCRRPQVAASGQRGRAITPCGYICLTAVQFVIDVEPLPDRLSCGPGHSRIVDEHTKFGTRFVWARRSSECRSIQPRGVPVRPPHSYQRNSVAGSVYAGTLVGNDTHVSRTGVVPNERGARAAAR